MTIFGLFITWGKWRIICCQRIWQDLARQIQSLGSPETLTGILTVEDPGNDHQRKRVTQLEYFKHHLHPCQGKSNHLFIARKLFQDYAVDSWATTEQRCYERSTLFLSHSLFLMNSMRLASCYTSFLMHLFYSHEALPRSLISDLFMPHVPLSLPRSLFYPWTIVILRLPFGYINPYVLYSSSLACSYLW